VQLPENTHRLDTAPESFIASHQAPIELLGRGICAAVRRARRSQGAVQRHPVPRAEAGQRGQAAAGGPGSMQLLQPPGRRHRVRRQRSGRYGSGASKCARYSGRVANVSRASHCGTSMTELLLQLPDPSFAGAAASPTASGPTGHLRTARHLPKHLRTGRSNGRWNLRPQRPLCPTSTFNRTFHRRSCRCLCQLSSSTHWPFRATCHLAKRSAAKRAPAPGTFSISCKVFVSGGPLAVMWSS